MVDADAIIASAMARRCIDARIVDGVLFLFRAHRAVLMWSPSDLL